MAFLLFLAAGVSDAVDGFLAKRFGMTTELGAYLDPLADKVLIVSIYVTLGITGVIPRWLVILVVSRDFMIVGAIMLSWLVGRPVDDQAAHRLQGQHRGADRVRRPGAGLARFRFRRRTGVDTGDGAGRGLDLAFGRPLSRRVDAPHEFDGSRRLTPQPRPGAAMVRSAMTLERQVMFWAAGARRVRGCVLWLLSDILLPFVAGMALAYLLDPLAGGLERLGIGRAVSALIVLTRRDRRVGGRGDAGRAPILGEQLAAFMDNLPGYVAQAAVADDRSEPALAAPRSSASGLPTPASRSAVW